VRRSSFREVAKELEDLSAEKSTERHTAKYHVSKAQFRANMSFIDEDHDRVVAGDIKKLMYTYGFSRDQLDVQLHPEEHAVSSATVSRTGIWLFFLNLSVNKWFTLLCFLSIAANTIFMGFQANAMAEKARGRRDSLAEYKVVESLFVTWFLVESVIRCLGHPSQFWRDRLLLFDIAIVAASAFEIWILVPTGAVGDAGMTVSIFVVLRVLRLARAVKLLRSVEAFQPLYTMLQAVWHSKANFLCVCLVLSLYLFGTSLIVQALIGPYAGHAYELMEDDMLRQRFSSIGHCMLTLVEILFEGDEWGPNVVEKLLNEDNEEAKISGVILLVFALLGQFFVMNLVAALFIEQMFSTVRVNKTVMERESMYANQHDSEEMRKIFEEIAQGRTALTWREYAKGLSANPDLVMQLGINLEVAKALFHQLSYDVSETVSIEEFIFGMIKLTRQSKSIDMLVIDYQQQRAQRCVAKLNKRFTDDTARLRQSTKQLAKRLAGIMSDCAPLRSFLKRRLTKQLRPDNRSGDPGAQPLSPNADTAAAAASGLRQAGNTGRGDATLSSSTSQVPRAKVGPDPPAWEAWLQLLNREGRPVMRKRLAAALQGDGSLGSRVGHGGTSQAGEPLLSATAGTQVSFGIGQSRATGSIGR